MHVILEDCGYLLLSLPQGGFDVQDFHGRGLSALVAAPRGGFDSGRFFGSRDLNFVDDQDFQVGQFLRFIILDNHNL